MYLALRIKGVKWHKVKEFGSNMITFGSIFTMFPFFFFLQYCEN